MFPVWSRGVRRVEGCYLLHFDSKVHGAQHYLGWSVHIARRLRQHLKGDGARLVRQALRAGVGVELVRVWTTADRKLERVLKVRTPKSYCPKCRTRPEPVSDEVLVLLSGGRPPGLRSVGRTPEDARGDIRYGGKGSVNVPRIRVAPTSARVPPRRSDTSRTLGTDPAV
jgi:hypothetical protein